MHVCQLIMVLFYMHLNGLPFSLSTVVLITFTVALMATACLNLLNEFPPFRGHAEEATLIFILFYLNYRRLHSHLY